MTELGSAIQKVPWGVWAVTPVILQVIFRKRGSYAYRKFVAFFNMFLSAFYGVVAGVPLALVGKAYLINYQVGQVNIFLNKLFLAIGATVEGKEHLLGKDKRAIYVVNHQTTMDIMYMGHTLQKGCSIVSKKSVKWVPVLGLFMILSKTVFLDRGSRDNAVKQARQAAEDIHKKKTSLWIYPEGTRSRSKEITLLPFKKGAFHIAKQANVPIIPVVIANYSNIYDPKEKHFGYGDIKIKVLPAISTEEIDPSPESIEKLSNFVREQMLATLQEISYKSDLSGKKVE